MQGSIPGALDAINAHRHRTSNLPATVEYPVKGCVAPERPGLLHLPFVADRKLLTPSGPATCKHLASVLRGHTGAESVRIPAFPIVRLKCPLHVLPSLLS
jgi:hypothetical protein